MTARSVSKRISRARSVDWSFDVVPGEAGPFDQPEIEIESASEDDEYVIIPEQAYCSCPDFEHRDVPCKHLLAIALDECNRPVPGHIRRRLLRAVRSERERLDDVVIHLKERLDDVREQRDRWEKAENKTHLGFDPARARDEAGVDDEFKARVDNIIEENDEILRDMHDDPIDYLASTARKR